MKIENLVIWVVILISIFARYLSIKPNYYSGDRVKITSLVYSDPIRYEKSQYLKIAGLKVYLPLFPEITYGDKVVLEGIVDGDKLKNPKLISIIESKNILTKYRKSIIKLYNQTLPNPESGLLAGIVLGARGSMDKEFYDATRAIGLTHVIVASGTNISYLVTFLMALLTKFINRRKAIYIVILSILLYLFISGFDAPLVRASVMACVLFISEKAGRLVNSWRILMLTAGGMLIVNPLWLKDIGFILSFVSTSSLMLFQRKIDKKIIFIPKFLRESISTSLSAQIGVGPILFVTFGQFNILSVLVNALVLWTIPFIMAIGAVGGILHLKFIIYLSYPFLWWFTTIVKLFSF